MIATLGIMHVILPDLRPPSKPAGPNMAPKFAITLAFFHPNVHLLLPCRVDVQLDTMSACWVDTISLCIFVKNVRLMLSFNLRMGIVRYM